MWHNDMAFDNNSNHRDAHVTAYLDSFLPQSQVGERIKCCGSSRSFFCSECCQLLARAEDLPSCIRDGTLKLPFNLHILLDDQRSAATGLHATALLGGEQVSVMDIKRDNSPIMDYSECSKAYVLFPCDDSVPLSSVQDISTLVVLDCKWTRTASCELLVSGLPRVHLTAPPLQSQFWRSHTAAEGCLSTIEAIYYAAIELDPNNTDLIHLFWLFGKQRAAIQAKGPWKGRDMPYTENGKEAMRALRRQREN